MGTQKLDHTPLHEIISFHDAIRSEFLNEKTKSIDFRKEQLSQLAYMVQDNLGRFKEALGQDSGRAPYEGLLAELSVCLNAATEAFNNVEAWAKPEKATFDINYTFMKPTIRKEAKGVVLIIGSYNYPLVVTLLPAASAIAAGNAVVLKPSEHSPAVAALITELFPRYLDPNLYRVVNGGVPETTKLLDLKWDHILYTGSARVGRIVAQAAAKHLTPVTLEHVNLGKNPCFVDPGYDLKLASRRISWGRFSNCGQTCVSPDYLLVPAEAQDKVVDALLQVNKEFYPAGALQSDSYSRIITEANFTRLKGLLESTQGTIVFGGEIDRERKFIAPTLVRDVALDDALMGEEIFGPILPIVPVKDIDEALEIINARELPLAAYCFSDNESLKKKFADRTRSGAVLFNETVIQVAVTGLPFGGVGASGYGQHTGKSGFDTFTHQRSTLDAPKFVEFIMRNRYPPYTAAKEKFITRMLVPKLPPRVAQLRSARKWPPGLKWLGALCVCALLAAGLRMKLAEQIAALGRRHLLRN